MPPQDRNQPGAQEKFLLQPAPNFTPYGNFIHSYCMQSTCGLCAGPGSLQQVRAGPTSIHTGTSTSTSKINPRPSQDPPHALSSGLPLAPSARWKKKPCAVPHTTSKTPVPPLRCQSEGRPRSPVRARGVASTTVRSPSVNDISRDDHPWSRGGKEHFVPWETGVSEGARSIGT